MRRQEKVARARTLEKQVTQQSMPQSLTLSSDSRDLSVCLAYIWWHLTLPIFAFYFVFSCLSSSSSLCCFLFLSPSLAAWWLLRARPLRCVCLFPCLCRFRLTRCDLLLPLFVSSSLPPLLFSLPFASVFNVSPNIMLSKLVTLLNSTYFPHSLSLSPFMRVCVRECVIAFRYSAAATELCKSCSECPLIFLRTFAFAFSFYKVMSLSFAM